jgi:type I restriction enzyme, S subunit
VDKVQPKRLFKCILRPGEVIIVRSGVNTGDCAPVPADLAGAYAAYDLILRLREGHDSIRPDFLCAFLDTRVGRIQMNVLKGRAAQPHVNAEEVRSLLVAAPSDKAQVRLMADLASARAARRKMLRQAEDLLTSLSDFVLNAVGLTLPSPDTRLAYAAKLSESHQRLDANYHTPRFRELQRRLLRLDTAALRTICRFSSERADPRTGHGSTFRYLEISNVDSETGEAQPIETLRSEAPSRARMLVHDGDIIVSLTRPQRGSIALIDSSLDGCIASTGFAVLTKIGENEVDANFLWAFLRTQAGLLQMLQRSSGGNYPAITEDELGCILVPLPGDKIKRKVAEEGARRREAARKLRDEAARVWETAKQRFEEELLAPENNSEIPNPNLPRGGGRNA